MQENFLIRELRLRLELSEQDASDEEVLDYAKKVGLNNTIQFEMAKKEFKESLSKAIISDIERLKRLFNGRKNEENSATKNYCKWHLDGHCNWQTGCGEIYHNHHIQEIRQPKFCEFCGGEILITTTMTGN